MDQVALGVRNVEYGEGWLVLLAFGFACASPSPSDTETPVFGGVGAVVEVPAPSEDAAKGDSAAAAGPCTLPRPVGDHALIDDFEDGDGRAFKAFARDAWWWAASDGTPGSTLSPAPGQFKPELRDDPPATSTTQRGEVPRADANMYAAHFVASGQTDWGASWGTTLRWLGDGLKCPYNASGYAGVRFVARGTQPVFLQVSTPATTPLDAELGECKASCWDSFTRLIPLTPEWQQFMVPFASLQQRGFGTEVRFDPARVLGVMFQASPNQLPADFWVDDLAFVTADEVARWAAADPGP